MLINNNLENRFSSLCYGKFLKFLSIILQLFFATLFFFTFFTHAQSSSNLSVEQLGSYELREIANIKNKAIIDNQWVSIIANPRNKYLYYLTNTTGQLYKVDEGEITVPAIGEFYPRNLSAENTRLNAIVLHPNFAFSDRVGFATFYTAHVEAINRNKKTKRLSATQNNIKYVFDAVITEWQFNHANFKKMAVNSKREIIRIALSDKTHAITQLAFNPSTKLWDDDYGLLYFSLGYDQQLANYPLYSGAILRIKPNKFGNKAYTTPQSNPFIADPKLVNELFIVGAQQIDAFIWPDKNKNSLLVSHQVNQTHFLSLNEQKYDWRQKPPKPVFSQNSSPLSLTAYQGRNLISLSKSILFLAQKNDHWQLQASTYESIYSSETSVNQQQKKVLFFNTVWQLDNDLIAPQDNMQLYIDSSHELLLMDNGSQFIYSLHYKKIARDKYNKSQGVNHIAISNSNEDIATSSQEIISEPINSIVVFFVVALLGLSLLLLARYYFHNKKSLSTLIKQSYSRLTIKELGQQTHMALYKHRQKVASVTLNIDDIISSEIWLNDELISHLSTQAEHKQPFSNVLESDIRDCFSDAHKIKMIDTQVRKVCLLLIDKNKQNHLITLYLRRGNHRFTKLKYRQIVDNLMDWCWLYSQKIMPAETEDRIIIVNEVANEKSIPKKHSPIIKKECSDKAPVVSNVKQKIAEPLPSENLNTQSTQSHIIDTELVNALEKLVALKKQGFLTEDEFELAKQKLLKDLFSDKD